MLLLDKVFNIRSDKYFLNINTVISCQHVPPYKAIISFREKNEKILETTAWLYNIKCFTVSRNSVEEILAAMKL